MDFVGQLLHQTAFFGLTPGHVVMWIIGLTLIYLAIKKEFEPLLLLPIGFGTIIVNLPLSGMLGDHGLLRIFYYGIEYEVVPCVIFLGLGALTDFGPMIANPKTLILGAAAQFGVYIAFFGAIALGFDPREACSIGIIGGADGPTTIFLTQAKAPHILGATAVSAYSYMSLVPVLQPPVMRLLTTKEERRIRMRQLRPVSKTEKILFPLIALFVICLLVPSIAPLMAMFMVGNLFRESGVVQRLSNTAQNELMNIVVMSLGLSITVTMRAEDFLQLKVIKIFSLGIVAFTFCFAGGILMAKFMNLFLKEKINPLIGAAGVSAVPMSARVVQVVGQKEDPQNFLLMHAMGPNVAGVIGTATAAGVFMTLL
jgi:oxaloacetate decarboxylase beta subunit